MSFRPVITLANSIIGVAVLSMPYCFKQCGIILAIVMILCSGILVKVTCHLLLKSAILARRRNFENLAFQTFGTTGKLLIELGIIGYLVGVTIAFFVVMGDLGPPIIANFLELENNSNLRLIILTALGLFVALPLSLIRNIASLQHICAASIGFYCFVVLRVVLESSYNLKSGQWLSEVNLWRPSGMLQCFPIFSMALACQTNIFEVYASLPDATPAKMTEVVKGAVNICTVIYITIGFFGYVAFYYTDVGGDILTNFEHTTFIQLIKLGFCISVALSFPLVMFPCRTSLHSLLFRKTYQGIGSTELVTDYIPPTRFNLITVCLILFCLTIGILIPDIELVLGFVGSTMGASVCVIFPGAIFLKLSTKETTERLAARAVLVIGVVMLILGSYVNLEEASRSSVDYPNKFVQPAPGIIDVEAKKDLDTEVKDKIEKDANEIIKNISSESSKKKSSAEINKVAENGRMEPAIPEEPRVEKIENINVNVKLDDAVVEEPKEEDSKVDSKEDKVDQVEVKKESEEKLRPEETVDRDKKESDVEKKDEVNAEKLLKELKRQKEESEKILEKQKEILKELEEHKKNDLQDEVIEPKLSNQNQPQADNNNLQQQNFQNVQTAPVQSNQQQQQMNPNKKQKKMLIQQQQQYQNVQAQQQPVKQQQQTQYQNIPNQGNQQLPIQQQAPSQQQVDQQQQQQQPSQTQQLLQQQQQPVQQHQPLQQQQVPIKRQPQIVQQQPLPQQQQQVAPQQQQQQQPYKQNQNLPQQQNQQLPIQQQMPIQQQQQLPIQQQQQLPLTQQQQPLQQNQMAMQQIQHQLPLQQNQQQPMQQNQQQHLSLQQQQLPPQQNQQQPIQQQQQIPLQQQVPSQQQNVKKKELPHVPSNLNYNVNADIKHGLEAYDQEQRDLIKPVVKEEKVPGRDLKEDRSKRSLTGVEKEVKVSIVDENSCLNDPFCDEKFSRDPSSDSFGERDITKFLKVGNSRSLLDVETDANKSEKIIQR